MIAASISGGRARSRPVVTSAIVLLVAGGLLLTGNGLWIKAKAGLAQYLLQRAFAETIATGKPVKPWSWADTWPVARIEVPRLAKNIVALEGASGQALAFGPGHLSRSSAPGQEGTSVFAAHRDTQFSFLGKLVPGDVVRVTWKTGKVFRYVVTGSQVVRWNASGIDPDASGRWLALATCWPIGGLVRGPMRYVVHARLANASSD